MTESAPELPWRKTRERIGIKLARLARQRPPQKPLIPERLAYHIAEATRPGVLWRPPPAPSRPRLWRWWMTGALFLSATTLLVVLNWQLLLRGLRWG